MFESFGRKKRKPQAARGERVDLGRREALKKVGGAAAGIALATAGGAGGLVIKEALKGKESKDALEVPGPAKENASQESVTNSVEAKEDPLAPYTFLNVDARPISVQTGEIEGMHLDDLYAAYLGVPSGTVAPGELKLDFKAVLAALWKRKCELAISDARFTGDERQKWEALLRGNKSLMDLAEAKYRAYSTEPTQQMPLDDGTKNDYRQVVADDVADGHQKFADAIDAFARQEERDPQHSDPHFTHPRRLLMVKLAHIRAEDLIACSLTELMPSEDGRKNATVFDFLLRNAGADFVYCLPAIYDTQLSFGPYQITPMLFGSGAGTYAERFEQQLPKGYMPERVEDVSGTLNHRVAYVAAVEHIVQLVGMMSDDEVAHARKALHFMANETLHREILTFIATTHHRPKDAYEHFRQFLKNAPTEYHTKAIPPSYRDLKHDELRLYAKKAVANYEFLTSRGALASINDEA